MPLSSRRRSALRVWVLSVALLAALGALSAPSAAEPDGAPSAAEPDGAPDGVSQAPPAPVTARPVGGAVSRPFDPPVTRFGSGHRGVDLVAEPGDEVRAVRAGSVSFAGQVAGRGWVTIDHGGGLDTTYGVLREWRVRKGQQVEAGEVIGTLGEEVTHLDLGARRNGEYVDPMDLFGTWRTVLVDPGSLVDPITVGAYGALPPMGDGPLAWPTAGRVGSGFGYRIHPISGVRKLHAGVDIGAPTGTPIVAAAAGRVVRAGVAGGYGNLVELDHGGGLFTRYAHASRLLVRAGQTVQRGQVIALVGSTGASTGPHLHFEVRPGGTAVDPLPYL